MQVPPSSDHALWSLNLVQVTESISGSVVPLAMFINHVFVGVFQYNLADPSMKIFKLGKIVTLKGPFSMFASGRAAQY